MSGRKLLDPPSYFAICTNVTFVLVYTNWLWIHAAAKKEIIASIPLCLSSRAFQPASSRSLLWRHFYFSLKVQFTPGLKQHTILTIPAIQITARTSLIRFERSLASHFYGIFYDVVSITEFIALYDWWVMNWKAFGKRRSWLNGDGILAIAWRMWKRPRISQNGLQYFSRYASLAFP